MPSVLRRYLSRELLQYWLVFTLVLWLILVTARFSLYLGQAAEGQLPAATILTLLALKSVGFFVFLLPVTLYLALLWLLGRLNRDHETLALGASGFGIRHMYQTLAGPVVLVTLLVALLSFYLVPYTAEQGYRVRAEAQRELNAANLAAGVFHTLAGGEWQLYAQRPGDAAGQLRDLFIHRRQDKGEQILVAQRAHFETDHHGGRILVLQQGYRYDGEPGQADYRVLSYRQYEIRLSAPSRQDFKWDAVSTRELLRDSQPAARAQWQQRLSRPLSVLVLALLAVPLARFRPATSRFYPLWLGVLAFALYFNLLTTSELWLAREQIPGWLGLWWVHLLMLLSAVLWLRPWRGARSSA